MCPLYWFLQTLNPFPLKFPPLSPLVTVHCSQFQCLWLYFACLFVLLIRFLLKLRSYAGLCFLLLRIFLAIPFWLGVFPLRSQVLVLSGLPYILLPVSPFLTLRFSLSCNFAILIMICLRVSLFGLPLNGTLCVSWICVTLSLIKRGKFSNIIFSNRFSVPCSSSPSVTLIIQTLVFMLS
ncbi:hypothetical protein HJG60_010885 [Phyllostomus discolor]|uniref:Uncharacterized protein n=1 Tax=Phyllostomus discolor TaxID=89673 RepID=A0A834A723_9CHIR|nr:hypothetical protein HJG60_010885 [Phyllostomus discolor]